MKWIIISETAGGNYDDLTFQEDKERRIKILEEALQKELNTSNQ